MSSFGGPGAKPTTKPTPPQRGSFPLDHEGECKHIMSSYLSCMQKVKGINEDECRDLAKAYLGCRMDRNLMARDKFENLGYAEKAAGKVDGVKQGKPNGKDKGVPGELQW